MSTWSSNPELLAATGGAGPISSNNSLQSLQTGSGSSSTTHPYELTPPPDAPDISELTGLLNHIPGMFNAGKISKAFNNEINTTRSSGFQAAAGAGESYAAREAQLGITPVSAGAVEASARAPTYKAVNDLTKDKEAAKLEAHKEAASLSAQISAAIGNIRSGYVKTLADYNLGAAGLEEKHSEFNDSLDFSREQARTGQQFDLAKILASTPGGGSSEFARWLKGMLGVQREGTPGYIPGGAGGGPIDVATGDYAFNGHSASLGLI